MTDSYETCITVARAELAEARRLITREISAYPAPISGCDAQFNHLLAERARIANTLAALEATPFVPTPRQPTPQTPVESR